jgi:hypothetical protein
MKDWKTTIAGMFCILIAFGLLLFGSEQSRIEAAPLIAAGLALFWAKDR